MRRLSRVPKDPNQLAAAVVRLSTEESKDHERSPVSQYLSDIGRKGGLKGGKIRAEKLSPSKRRAIAQKAAKARWKNKKNPKQ
jgi:hypothetical protein